MNETRRGNYIHAILLKRPENFNQAILKDSQLFGLSHIAFQFLIILLKSITDPFIFSIAIGVEKMEIRQVNNRIISQELTINETNCQDPYKSYSLVKGIDSFMFLFCITFLSSTINHSNESNLFLINLTWNKNNTSILLNSLILNIEQILR